MVERSAIARLSLYLTRMAACSQLRRCGAGLALPSPWTESVRARLGCAWSRTLPSSRVLIHDAL